MYVNHLPIANGMMAVPDQPGFDIQIGWQMKCRLGQPQGACTYLNAQEVSSWLRVSFAMFAIQELAFLCICGTPPET